MPVQFSSGTIVSTFASWLEVHAFLKLEIEISEEKKRLFTFYTIKLYALTNTEL